MGSIVFKAADGFTLHGQLYGDPGACRSARLIVRGLKADYLVGVGGDHDASLSFADDEYMSARNTADMHAFHAAPTLWPQVSQWLALHTAA